MSQHTSSNISWHGGSVSRVDRERLLKQRGATVWLTGLSGAGKSTIAVILEQMLLERGRLAYRLDGDNVRYGLNKNLGFSAEDRAENIRRIGEVAKLFTDAGVIVIASFISPYRRDRAAVRALMGPDDFVEVYVKVSIGVAEGRDPKGLYKKARAGEIKGFTGVDDPYEVPENPEIVVDTERLSPEDAAREILSALSFAPQATDPAVQDRVYQVFQNLDDWRHLPNYQLERRADAFFSVYIRELVERHVKEPLKRTVIPELPIKQLNSNRSDKVDYVLFGASGERVYFVELKTDNASVRNAQDDYLKASQSGGFANLLRDLEDVVCATSSRRKYLHLLRRLSDAGAILMTNELSRGAHGEAILPGSLTKGCLKAVGNPEIRVIYLVPSAREGCDCITFGDVIEYLASLPDEFSATFAKFLRAWSSPVGVPKQHQSS
jgi:adenylylsulfate kinase